jgi:hypothetical protein
MPLHIFLGNEVLLYFIVRVEVVEIQISLHFIKKLKRKKNFLFLLAIWVESQPRPSWPSPAHGPASRRRGPAVYQARTRVVKRIRPDNVESDPIGG